MRNTEEVEEENFKKLKVSNFPSSLDTDEVEEYFESFKPKSCKVIRKASLFAILEFSTNQEGKLCLEEMNDKKIDDFTFKVEKFIEFKIKI